MANWEYDKNGDHESIGNEIVSIIVFGLLLFFVMCLAS